MYKAKLWDEDKWNIHSSSYGSSKYGKTIINDKSDDKKYNKQRYGTKEKDVSSDYIRKEEREKENANIFDNLEEEKNNQEIKEDEIPFKAAKQVFAENQHKIITKKKEVKT